MTIAFQCPHCKSSLKAPKKYAGGNARCKSCGIKIRIPGNESNESIFLDDDLFAVLVEQPLQQPTADRSIKPETPATILPQLSGQGRFVSIVVGCSITILVISIAVIYLVKQHRIKQRNEAVSQLTAILEKAISRADKHTDQFDYDTAISTLEGAIDEIARKPHADAVNQRLTQELERRTKDKHDYNKKIAQGYVIFEGSLIPSQERDRILDGRLEEQKREEKRRIAEAKRREEEKRRQKQLAIERARNERLRFVLQSLWPIRANTNSLNYTLDQVLKELRLIGTVSLSMEVTNGRNYWIDNFQAYRYQMAEISPNHAYDEVNVDNLLKCGGCTTNKTFVFVSLASVISETGPWVITIYVTLDKLYKANYDNWPDRRKIELRDLLEYNAKQWANQFDVDRRIIFIVNVW